MQLTVIIPAYNVEKTLENCVNSVLKQGINQMEVLIVDDGAKDGTPKLCDELAAKFDCVSVIHQDNEGVSAARNHGIKMAKGEWITFVDGDDSLQPEAFKGFDLNSIKEDVVLFKYKNHVLDKNGGIGKESVVNTAELQSLVLDFPSNASKVSGVNVMDGVNNWTCWGKLFKKSIILDNDITFPIGITHGEDLIFNYKYYSYCKKARLVEKDFYYYRLDSGSVSHKFNPNRLLNNQKIFDALKNIDINIEKTKEYKLFVFDRLYTSCKMYFSNDNTVMSIDEKEKKLKQICEEKDYKEALTINDLKNLSMGYRTKIKKYYVLQLLKHKKYKKVVNLFN